MVSSHKSLVEMPSSTCVLQENQHAKPQRHINNLLRICLQEHVAQRMSNPSRHETEQNTWDVLCVI